MTAGIRVEPPSPGQLYFKALLPDEAMRPRARRVSQPWELHLTPGDDYRPPVESEIKRTTVIRVDLLSGDRFAHVLSPGQGAWLVPEGTAPPDRSAVIAAAREVTRTKYPNADDVLVEDHVVDRFAAVEGVADVSVYGDREPLVRVLVEQIGVGGLIFAGLGASLWASGSQVCIGARPILVP